MAGNIEVAKAFVTIVPSLEGSQATITKELTGVTSEASEKAGKDGGGKFADSFGKALKGAAATIGGALTAATAAAAGAGKSFLTAASDTATLGDNVDKTSQRLGISTESFQKWDYALNLAGTSMNDMQTGMKTLTNKLDDAKNGSEGAQEMFAKLGLSMEDLNSMSREDVFENVIYGMQALADGTDRAALANDLFGKSGQTLTPIFNQTTEATKAQLQAAEDYGMVMSEDAVKASAGFVDSLTTLKKTLTGLKTSMMSSFLPSLSSVMDGLAKVFSGDESGIGQITIGLGSLINQLTTVAPQFFSLAQTLVMSLLQGFAPMIPQLASTIFETLNTALVTIVSMLPELLPTIETGIATTMKSVLDCLPIIIDSLLTLVTDLVTWLSEGDNIKKFLEGIISLVEGICAKMNDVLPVLLPAIIEIIAQVALTLTDPNNVMTILKAVILVFEAVVKALIAAAPKLLDFVINLGKNIYETIKGALKWLADLITPWLKAAIDKFSEWGSKIKEWAKGLVDKIKTGFNTWITNLKTSITTALENIKTKISTWITNIKTAFSNGFDTIKEKISNILDKIKEFVGNCIDKIKELPEKALDIGKNLIIGLWNGIADKTDWVIQKIKGIGSTIIDAIEGVFGVASPSKVFAEIGGYLAKGLGVGFDKEIDGVRDDMVGSMNGLTASMTGTVVANGTAGVSTMSGANLNYGGNTINVYAAEGQNVEELAQVISVKLEQMTRRKGAVYA